MTPGAKILVTAAALCIAVWAGLMALGVQPLREVSSADVVYGEGEDFFSDAVAYGKIRNGSFLLLYLPHARPEHRWVAVDFTNKMIAFTVPARFLGSIKYRLKRDKQGEAIETLVPPGSWQWHFTDQGTSFSGNGFFCRVRWNVSR